MAGMTITLLSGRTEKGSDSKFIIISYRVMGNLFNVDKPITFDLVF